MKVDKLSLFLIVVSFELATSKIFDRCEFAKELYLLHTVPRDEIYMHLCITRTVMDTSDASMSFLGVYRIGSQWWCGENEAGGSCNVKCSELVDDDIADDVACANKILDSHGLDGWTQTESRCKSKFQKFTDECLADIEVLESLQRVENVETTESEVRASTTRTLSRTGRPGWYDTTTASVLRSTEGLLWLKMSAKEIPAAPTPSVASAEQKSSSVATAFVIIFALLIIALLIFGVIKYRSSKRVGTDYNHEFSNSLA